MKKLFVILIIAVSSCKGDAKTSTQDGDYSIDLIIEHDGCRVYRFNDGGTYIYWSDCRGRTEWKTTSGKTTIRHQVLNN